MNKLIFLTNIIIRKIFYHFYFRVTPLDIVVFLKKKKENLYVDYFSSPKCIKPSKYKRDISTFSSQTFLFVIDPYKQTTMGLVLGWVSEQTLSSHEHTADSRDTEHLFPTVTHSCHSKYSSAHSSLCLSSLFSEFHTFHHITSYCDTPVYPIYPSFFKKNATQNTIKSVNK